MECGARLDYEFSLNIGTRLEYRPVMKNERRLGCQTGLEYGTSLEFGSKLEFRTSLNCEASLK